jgi:adenosylcobinamide-GDP ribazoletransferase
VWAPLALAWSFLTVLPAPTIEADAGTLRASLAFFPVVGLVVGALLGGLGLALDRILPAGPVAVPLLAGGVLLSGALHLDGLMDTADGVFGGRTVERRLEIMRDSRVGSFGALAGGLVLLGQYAALSNLSGPGRLIALVLAYVLSRWSLVLAIGAFPAARPSGLGATFQKAGSRWPLLVATLGVLVACAVTRELGVAALLAALLVTAVGGKFLTARLGGLTGDTYGFLAVLVETVVLYLAVGMGTASR